MPTVAGRLRSDLPSPHLNKIRRFGSARIVCPESGESVRLWAVPQRPQKPPGTKILPAKRSCVRIRSDDECWFGQVYVLFSCIHHGEQHDLALVQWFVPLPRMDVTACPILRFLEPSRDRFTSHSVVSLKSIQGLFHCVPRPGHPGQFYENIHVFAQ
jgi:hypothetical protein